MAVAARPKEDDFNQGFIASAKYALERLKSLEEQLRREHEEPLKLIESYSEVLDIIDQLEAEYISISFIGRLNSGKSTLLNAIIGDKLLPQSFICETGIRVYIQHSEDCHRGCCHLSEELAPCPSCPKLLPFQSGCSTSEVLGQISMMIGRKDISRFLHDLNREQRDDSNPQEGKYQLLLAHVPILSHVNHAQLRVYLVDTPGFSDANKGIAKLAENSARTSSGYVYLMNCNGLADSADIDYLRMLYHKDPNIFEACRLLIVVSKFDEFYREVDDDNDDSNASEMSEHAIKKHVCRSIERALSLKTPIPEDTVLMVSGTWAHYAQQYPHKLSIQKKVPALLDAYYRKRGQPSGQRGLADVQKELLAASGIKELEGRIADIANKCLLHWVANVKLCCLSYLRSAAGRIGETVAAHQKTVDAWKVDYSCRQAWYDNIHLHKDYLTQTLLEETKSTVYQHLQGAYETDVQEQLEDAKKKASSQHEQFLSDCAARAANGHYKHGQFKEDMRIFLDETAVHIRSLLDLIKFEMINKVLTRCLQKTTEVCTKMSDTAELYCGTPQLVSRQQDFTAQASPSPTPQRRPSVWIQDRHNIPNPNLQTLQREINIPQFHLSGPKLFGMVISTLKLLLRSSSGADAEPLAITLRKAWRKYIRPYHLHAESPMTDPALGPVSETQLDPEFQIDPETVLTKEQVEVVLGDLHEALVKKCEDYFQEIKPFVVRYFYGEYKTETKSDMKTFRVKFQKDIDEQKKKYDQLKQKFEAEEQYVQELRQWQQHLLQLQDHICKKADSVIA